MPFRSYLYVKGDLENFDKVHFVIEGFAFLFNKIRYKVKNKEVDMVSDRGIPILMKLLGLTNRLNKYSNAAFGTNANLKNVIKMIILVVFHFKC